MRRVLPALLAGIAIGAFVSAPSQSASAVLSSTAVSWEEIQATPSGTGVTKAKQIYHVFRWNSPGMLKAKASP